MKAIIIILMVLSMLKYTNSRGDGFYFSFFCCPLAILLFCLNY